jgi:hypothetical protein
MTSVKRHKHRWRWTPLGGCPMWVRRCLCGKMGQGVRYPSLEGKK